MNIIVRVNYCHAFTSPPCGEGELFTAEYNYKAMRCLKWLSLVCAIIKSFI